MPVPTFRTASKVRSIPYGYLSDSNELEANSNNVRPARLLIESHTVPVGFIVKIPGLHVELIDSATRALKERELYLRIDRFTQSGEGHFQVEFFHTGYGFIGGAFTKYEVRRFEARWEARFLDSFDP